MQIGDATVIAAEMGCPVVHRFRQADMAVGGQGAPLVPWADYVLFGHKRQNRVIQNIGGVANLTWLPASGKVEETIAFDTGPGNMMIDGLVRKQTKGREQFDRGGRRAARGRICLPVLEKLLRHPFLTELPPKSCGREQFGDALLAALSKQFRRQKLSANDWIATATHYSAMCMLIGYAMLCDLSGRNFPPMDEIILCGGGAKNRVLVEQLANCVTMGGNGATVTTTEEYGISAQAKEGLSFAMLAAACVDRVPANLSSVTGARRRVVLGQICDLGGES